ncbi:MAG: hypothetical protein R3C10_04620 [Pirellulales bacterium]
MELKKHIVCQTTLRCFVRRGPPGIADTRIDAGGAAACAPLRCRDFDGARSKTTRSSSVLSVSLARANVGRSDDQFLRTFAAARQRAARKLLETPHHAS